MDTYIKVLAVLTFATACYTQGFQFYGCSWISDPRIDCSIYSTAGHTLYCGRDGVTYDNSCFFSKTHCNLLSRSPPENLTLAHEGACGTVGTTPDPKHGDEVALDFFCQSLSHNSCGGQLEPICAIDGVTMVSMTYPNLCEFEKYRCTHRHIRLIVFGHCV